MTSDFATVGSLAFLQPSLLFRGEYTVVVTTDKGQAEEMEYFFGFSER